MFYSPVLTRLLSASHLSPSLSVLWHAGGAVGVSQPGQSQVSDRRLHNQQQTRKHSARHGFPQLRQVWVTKMVVFCFTDRAWFLSGKGDGKTISDLTRIRLNSWLVLCFLAAISAPLAWFCQYGATHKCTWTETGNWDLNGEYYVKLTFFIFIL